MKLKPELVTLLRDVINEHQPDLLPVAEQLIDGASIDLEDERRLILLLFSEVARTGFIEPGESVRRGLMLEKIAFAIMDASKSS